MNGFDKLAELLLRALARGEMQAGASQQAEPAPPKKTGPRRRARKTKKEPKK